jgi:hypothetical protein
LSFQFLKFPGKSGIMPENEMQDKSKTFSFEALLIESGIGPLSSAPRDLEVRIPCLMEDGLKGSCKPYMLIEKSKKVDGHLHHTSFY